MRKDGKLGIQTYLHPKELANHEATKWIDEKLHKYETITLQYTIDSQNRNPRRQIHHLEEERCEVEEKNETEAQSYFDRLWYSLSWPTRFDCGNAAAPPPSTPSRSVNLNTFSCCIEFRPWMPESQNHRLRHETSFDLNFQLWNYWDYEIDKRAESLRMELELELELEQE